MVGKITYAVNTGILDSAVVSDYDDRVTEFNNNRAFSNVSVNPVLKTVDINQENSAFAAAFVNSAIFTEIRKSSHTGSISNDAVSRIGNRILPVNSSPSSSDLALYATNKEETHGFKVKLYDSSISSSTTNRRFKFSTVTDTANNDYPSSDFVGIDIDNYDYFILINPDIVSVGTDSVRPHFAKVTGIVGFDKHGDGLEFSPSYPTGVPKNAKVEIFKGPAKTDTDVVAVSYGLRGDADASTPKYDVFNIASRPTFYFYNDRLDEDDQLDYTTKYTVTVLRWWNYGTTITGTTVYAHSQFDEGLENISQKSMIVSSSDYDKLTEGMSLFDTNGVYLGNIEGLWVNDPTGSPTYRLYLDYARVAISAASNVTLKIGKTIQNIVFRTESKFGDTVQNIGKHRLDAVLVDANRDLDDAGKQYNFAVESTGVLVNGALNANAGVNITVDTVDATTKFAIGDTVYDDADAVVGVVSAITSTQITLLANNAVALANNENIKRHIPDFNPMRWHKAFPRMHRQAANLLVVSNEVDSEGNVINVHGMTGPSKYLTFEKSELKNDKIPLVQGSNLNNPKNKMTKMAQVTYLDNSGIGHKKIKQDEILKMRNTTFTDNLGFKQIQGRTTIVSNVFRIMDLDSNYDLKSILAANSIVKIKGYYYVVDAVANKVTPTGMEATGVLVTGAKNINAHNTISVDTVDATTKFSVGDTLYDDTGTSVGVIGVVASTLITLADSATNSVALADNENLQKFTPNFEGDYQEFTIKAKRAESANTWTTSSTPEAAAVNQTISVAGYTHVLNVNFKADTEYDINQGRLTLNGRTINKEDAKLYDARCTFKLFNSHENKIEYADKVHKVIKLQDTDTKFYQTTGRRLNYYNGGYAIHEEVFSGVIEDIDTTTENGVNAITVTGRDDVSKFLSKTIKKNLVSSNDLVMSTLSTYTDTPITFKTSGGADVVGHSTLSTMLAGKVVTFTSVPVVNKYEIVVNQAGELLGEVSSVNSTALTLTHTICDTPTTSTTAIKHFDPFVDNTRLISFKSLQSNSAHTDTINDFASFSEKGLLFDKAIKLDGRVPSHTIIDVQGSSNTGDDFDDKTLGYDVNSIKSISTNDAHHAFYIGNENGIVNEITNYNSLNSESFAVVEVDEKSESETVISIAPKMPIVLGRIDTNTSDTRGNTHIYMVNNNINTGGYIHRLPNTFDGIYHPKETIRYWDLQTFEAGTLRRTSDTIYSEGIKPQKIQGYAVGYGTTVTGTVIDPAVTIDNKPILGSNTIKNYTQRTAFYGNHDLIESYQYDDGNTVKEYDIMYDVFEQIDPRTIPYELMATGDIYPFSKLRWNNLGFHTLSYDNFGILLESNPSVTGSTNHQLYDGTTKQTVKTENMFETGAIQSATQTTNQLRRWGVVRLVEATFDWHFNPVDFESLKPSEQIPTIPYFDYVMFDTPTADTGTIELAGDGQMSNESVTESDGDVFYDEHFIGAYPSTGDNVASGYAVITNTSGIVVPTESNGLISKIVGTGSTRFKTNAAFDNSGSNFTYGNTSGKDLLRFDGNSAVEGVERFRIHRTLDYMIDNLDTTTDANFLTDRRDALKNIRWTDVFFTRRGSKATSNFKFGRLLSGGAEYQAPDVILPIIAEEKINTGDNEDRLFSPFVHGTNWGSGARNFLHMSRVIAALVERYKSSNTNFSILDKYGMGLTDTNSDYFAHPYDSCIGVFKDIRLAETDSQVKLDTLSISSAPLLLHVDAAYDAYSASVAGAGSALDQHTRTSFIQSYPNSKTLSMIGTRTNADFLGVKKAIAAGTNTTHAACNSGDGVVCSAQMLVKPVFNLTHGSDGVTISNAQLTFVLNADTNHAWLSFMPNLTGYYIVSESLTDVSLSASAVAGSLRKDPDGGHPADIHKIISHTVSTLPTTSAIETHTITVDSNLTVDSANKYYRLMRISETTFDGHKDKIEFNVMKQRIPAFNWKKGGQDDDNLEYQESVYEMHLLLDIDNASTFIERRTNTAIDDNFTDGEIIDAYITDGNHSQRKKLTMATTRKKGSADSKTIEGLVMSFSGSLTGNGVVSFGEIFDVKLGQRPKIKNIKHCHIGSSYKIGTNIEKEVENIVKETGLIYDNSKSFSEFTGNVVDTVSTTTQGGILTYAIRCFDTVTNVNVGDILYSKDGHLIGKVHQVSSGLYLYFQYHLYYTPTRYDELIRINKRTFITSLSLEDIDVFTALNTLINKKGLDYTLKGKKIITRNLDDISSLRKYSVGYLEAHRLISVESNASLFDKANKVIVIGDKIRSELTSPIKGTDKVIRIVDSSIKDITEANQIAQETLKVHNGESRKITLTLEKKGLELLEAGDILTLNFPHHNIPKADYQVFEIENVLAGVMKITVGTFDKTIAERLSEISLEQKKSNISQMSKDALIVSAGLALFDSININFIDVTYDITSTIVANPNLGFDDAVGFTETVNFDTQTSLKSSYNDGVIERAEKYTDMMED